MDKIPFSVYDFFGYLSAGGVILFAAVFAIQGFDAFDADLTAAQVLMLVIAAYVVGYVIAAVSSFLLERRLTRRFIGTPTELLFKDKRPKGWRKILGAYHSPLPEATRKLVLTKASDAVGIDKPGEALFFHCFATVRHDAYPRERLASFLNLYGFARNVSMAALSAAAILAGSVFINDQVDTPELWIGAGAAFLVGIVMYFRYLKFYRQYSVELYVTYSGT